jgi:hypothetical protein
MSVRTVRVDLNGSGDWEIELSGRESVVTCETLADAQRVAYLFAARRRPCELIIRDAYHSVLRHELIDTDGFGDNPCDSPEDALLITSRGSECD